MNDIFQALLNGINFNITFFDENTVAFIQKDSDYSYEGLNFVVKRINSNWYLKNCNNFACISLETMVCCLDWLRQNPHPKQVENNKFLQRYYENNKYDD
jgi:hypothetical protein